jgi:diphthamide synthase subunit DPH2
MAAMGRDLIHLITVEYLQPNDICLIYNNQDVADLLLEKLAPMLTGIEVDLSIQTRQNFVRRANTVLATTSHSFKGHGTEAVLIPCADRFVGKGKILANNLFVAMTRARSHLTVYSSYSNFPMTGHINHAFRDCIVARDG